VGRPITPDGARAKSRFEGLDFDIRPSLEILARERAVLRLC